LTDTTNTEPEDMQTSYEAVAEAYTAPFFDELSRKPFDQVLLDAFAVDTKGRGAVLDVGCGPGHIARYLSDHGVKAEGLDFSLKMVELARKLNPGLEFRAGDMRVLKASDGSLAGIVAFYSVIHIPRSEVAGVLAGFRRALAEDGRLLLAVHGGAGSIHRDEFLGHAVPFEATLFSFGEIVSLVESAGFWVDEARQRHPYEFEHPTPRIYVRGHVAG
jgi:SAM-dependent methyltransferase